MISRLRIAVAISFFASASLDADSVRQRLSLNEGWSFVRGSVEDAAKSSDWESVKLPHSWNVEDAFDRLEAPDHVVAMDYYYRGLGTYRLDIEASRDWEGRRVEVLFEGALQRTRVWCNDVFLGEYVGGYSAFSFDLTPHLNLDAANELVVEVDNSYHFDIPPHRADYTMYGGLYRDAWLVVTDPLHLSKVFVDTPNVSQESAQVAVRTTVRNDHSEAAEGSLEAIFKGPDGKAMGRSSAAFVLAGGSETSVDLNGLSLPNPALWSPASPNLYTVELALKLKDEIVDQRQQRFGLRWFRFDPNRGFILNGSPLKVQGVNRHQDRAGYGFAVPNRLHREDIELIKAMGANFVRLAHYPQDPAVLEACDELGLLVWEEIPVVTGVGTEAFAATAKNMLRDMIEQHYNHPSIVVWGLMNETIRRQLDEELFWTVDLCRDLNALAKELDPSRVTAQAQFAARGTDIFDHSDIRGWNRYFGWYYDDFEGFGEWLDAQREVEPEAVIFISEYGAGIKRGYHLENPSQSDFTETWGTAFHKAHWKALMERPWVGGSTVWNMFDFGSEEKGGNIPGINQKGLADFDRRPKDVYYFYQSQWAEKLMAYIVSHTWVNRTGRIGETKTLEVFSNGDAVELFLNGNSLGRQTRQPGWHEWLWSTQLKEGINKLRAVAVKDGEIVEDNLLINYTVNLLEVEEGLE